MKLNARIAVIIVSLVIVAGLTVALISVHKARKARLCQEIRVELKVDTVSRLTPDAVLRFINRRHLNPVGQRCDSVNLARIEQELVTMPLVETAECYFDNRGILRVVLTERLPLFHVHTVVSDYCIDHRGRQMSTPDLVRDGVPVVTGDVTLDFAQGRLFEMISYIEQDETFAHDFLHYTVGRGNQVSTRSRSGGYLVHFGTADRYEQRLDKLSRFRRWQQKNNIETQYSEISLQYRDQIVCKHKTEQ